MKPFKFSLNAVKTLRQRQEQISLEAFGKAVRARTEAVEKQERRENELQTAWLHLQTLQTGGASIREINQVRGHCVILQQALTEAKRGVVRAQNVANEAWEALNDSRQQLELVNKFYDRRKEEYERELRQEEQKQLDEMAGRCWQARAVLTATESSWN